MTELERHLQATSDLITDPKHFTMGARARDENGISCMPESTRAVRWCTVGAWDRVTGYRHGENHHTLSAACGCNPTSINDRYGHYAVLAMLDQAIRWARPF